VRFAPLFQEVTMRASIAPAALFAVALAGCSGNVPTAPTAPAVPPAGTFIAPAVEAGRPVTQQSAAPRPIAGHCEATYAEPPVVDPPFVRHISVGTCQLSHLGQVRLRTEAELNFAIGVQTSEVTFTAANGDRLHASSVGTGTPTGPTTVSFTGTATIIGGTGRFANATGEMAVEGTVDNATGDARISYDGWIVYDASDRRGR
jgi:hypothetical protein